MKTLTIGDIHGRDAWVTQCSNPDLYDKIIFVGDYTDSFDKTNVEIYDNLTNIIKFKKENENKVELLIGNHDLQYMLSKGVDDRTYSCSGFRPEAWYDLNDLFNQNKELFKPVYQYKNYIWSHAGITKSLYYLIQSSNWSVKAMVSDVITNQFYYKRGPIFNTGMSRGGNNLIPGIFWADRSDTSHDLLGGYHQIVGHTPVGKITIKTGKGLILNNGKEKIYSPCSITYVDNENKESYVLNIE